MTSTPSEKARIVGAAGALNGSADPDLLAAAQLLLPTALATLNDVMTTSENGAARTAAAKAVLDVILKEQAARTPESATGVKAQRQAAAERVAGKFETPSAPRLVIAR